MQVPCPYILSRFIRVTLHHTSNIMINLVQLDLQGIAPETDRVYCNKSQGPGNYSNSSTVGFEPQTYCMAVWQPNHYTKIARPYNLNFIKQIYIPYNNTD